jgi:hypothetical protein
MGDEEQANDEQPAEDAAETARETAEDPNESTEGLLDEDTLREHAKRVSDAIQEAKNRNA